MQRTDYLSGLDGEIQHVKFTLSYSDLSTAGTTQTVQLLSDPGGPSIQTAGTSGTTLNTQNFQIPSGGIILYTRIKHTTAWAASGASSLTITLQKTGGTNFATPGTVVSGNLTAAVADTTLTESVGYNMSTNAAVGLCVLFTSIGANLSTFTAGQADVDIYYIGVSTPASAYGA